MNNIKNSFLEDEIFGTSVDSTNTLEELNYKDVINEDIEDNFDDTTQNKKMEIISTNIICDGRGFKELIENQQNGVDSPPDFSQYKSNNFKVTEVNNTLNDIEEKKAAINLTTDGEIMLRISENEPFLPITEEKASNVLTNFLGKPTVVGKGSRERHPDIAPHDLMLVSGIDMNLNAMAEFYKDGESPVYKHNKFTPSEFLKLDKNLPYKKPIYTLKLVAHLVNYNQKRFHYFMNWLAIMFIYLRKIPIAIVLRGDQGAGKGIFFNEVISKLFGEKYCLTIGNKNLKAQFLASLFEFRLFLNLNEISHDIKSNKELKNLIKELITALKMAFEKKYQNLSKEIDLFAQVLITSNEAYILEIEPKDRRITVFSTANNLTDENCKFFGLNDYKVFSKQIELETQDFALYLKNYPIDFALASKPMETVEKKALIKGTNDRFKLYITALLNKDITFFESLKETNSTLYSNLMSSLKKGRVYQRDLLPTFVAVNPGEFNMSPYKLLEKLEIYEPSKFSRDLRKKSGDWYFEL